MSKYIVAKPFLRGAVRYRRNEPAPEGLDAITQAEYLRLGMLAPAQTKPTGPAKRAAPAPRSTPQPKPTETKPAAQSATQTEAASADEATNSEANNSENVQQQAQGATEDVAQPTSEA